MAVDDGLRGLSWKEKEKERRKKKHLVLYDRVPKSYIRLENCIFDETPAYGRQTMQSDYDR